MRTITTLLLFLITFSPLYAQNDIPYNPRNCATMEVFDRMVELDPGYLERLNELEKYTQDYLLRNPTREAVLVIPVVVHVVYKLTSENISDAQVQSQLNVLNQDFRKLNPDVSNTPAPYNQLAADCMIQFCMATRDPNGAPTNGITRTKTKKSSFRTNDDVKFTNRGGHDAWPRDRYLNIWVCNLSGGVLGYAQFPGGNAATDGVVITHKGFGTTGTAAYPFNKGRTATHEIGHWLNLRHIWGDDGTGCYGTDHVDDTPNQGGYNYGCPPFPKVSCSNGPYGDLWMNYMDYTDDRCMYMFTTGQSGRMGAAVSYYRPTLQTSNGCLAPGDNITNIPDITSEPYEFRLAQNYPNPFNPVTNIKFSIPSSGITSLKVYDAAGTLIMTLLNRELNAGNHEINFDGNQLASGVYYYELSSGSFKDTKKMVLIK